MGNQIYKEIHIVPLEGGSVSTREVWRGLASNYVPTDLPPNTMRRFEIYVFGHGWVEVSRPIWAGSIASTNPQQEDME